MSLEYRAHMTRSMLQAEPETLFVFGDNLDRQGLGGQAYEMRGEPNAVGIPTKRHPTRKEDAYFTDADFDAWHAASMQNVARLMAHSGRIVWPRDGIGTGLAQLPQRAPRIWAAIENLRQELASAPGRLEPSRAPGVVLH